ncbi:MAG: phosphotransferase, partial [Candidatus Bathyarchaeota archaeon]
DWRKKYNINDFPIYNLEFRKKAQNYALQNFQRYYTKKPHAAFKKVLNEWDKISDVYVNYLKSDNEKLTTIHGDYNRTNLWIDKNNGNTLKIVDWEWSGIGLSHLDLASLLIGQPKHIEKEAILEFTKSQGEYTLKENQEHYTYSKLERAILDCSYVTGIDLSIKRKSRFNLNTFAINASLRILEAYSEMK